MIIYPNIELQNGRCVNLVYGQMDKPVIYDDAPLAKARQFQDIGAEWLHLVDLDGVLQGGRHNAELICDIIKELDISVQVGGGIRTMNSIEWWLDHGAAQVVLGTAAVKDRHLIKEACSHFPDQIIVSIDARGEKVVIEGWRTVTTFSALELAKDMQNIGVNGIIFTDIDRDNELPESSLATTTELATELDISVVSSGTVKTLDDIAVLKYLPNISGAIVGRALFNHNIDLDDALEIARREDEIAEFI